MRCIPVLGRWIDTDVDVESTRPDRTDLRPSSRDDPHSPTQWRISCMDLYSEENDNER